VGSLRHPARPDDNVTGNRPLHGRGPSRSNRPGLIALVFTLVTVAQATPAAPADDAYARHDYATARALYQAAVTTNPKDYRAWYRLARIAVAQGKPAEALSDLNSFSNASPVPAAAYRNDAIFAPFRTLPGYDAFVSSLEQKQYPCRFDPTARAMDRWVGKWTVTNPSGPGGSSIVERDFDGCVIVEHWTGQFGERGMSLTSYDTSAHRWVQHYVSDKGTATDYSGAAGESSVVFTAAGPTAQSKTRMTYTFLGDGRVEQRFDASIDGGVTWTPNSDLFYSPAAP